jgi:hypothetical protein
VVIVDEADSLFLDMAMNSARLALPSPFHTSYIYEIIFYYVKECEEKNLSVKVEYLRKQL